MLDNLVHVVRLIGGIRNKGVQERVVLMDVIGHTGVVGRRGGHPGTARSEKAVHYNTGKQTRCRGPLFHYTLNSVLTFLRTGAPLIFT